MFICWLHNILTVARRDRDALADWLGDAGSSQLAYHVLQRCDANHTTEYTETYAQTTAAIGLSRFKITSRIHQDNRTGQARYLPLDQVGITTSKGHNTVIYSLDVETFFNALTHWLATQQLVPHLDLDPESDPDKDQIFDNHSNLNHLLQKLAVQLGQLTADMRKQIKTGLQKLGESGLLTVFGRCQSCGARSWNYYLKSMWVEIKKASAAPPPVQTPPPPANKSPQKRYYQQPTKNKLDLSDYWNSINAVTPLYPIEQPAKPARPEHVSEQHWQQWHAARNQLEVQLDRANFDTWVRDAELQAVRPDGVWVFKARNDFAVQNLQHRLYRTIRRVLGDVYGQPVELEFFSDDPTTMPESNDSGPVSSHYQREISPVF